MAHRGSTEQRMSVAFAAGLLLIIAWTAHPPTAMAQGAIGEILGTVRDQNGAVVPGARVEILSERQGWTRNAVTTESGFYDASAVPAGLYTVKVEKEGFKGYT